MTQSVEHVEQPPTGIDRFCEPSEKDFGLLADELVREVREGGGETLVDIGDPLNASIASNVLSSGMLEQSIATVRRMAKTINAQASIVNRVVSEKGHGEACTMLVRQNVSEDDFTEVRVAVVGNVDAGLCQR